MRMDHVEHVRQKVKESGISYRQIADRAGVNRHWLTKFGTDKVSGISRKGLAYVEKLERFFESA